MKRMFGLSVFAITVSFWLAAGSDRVLRLVIRTPYRADRSQNGPTSNTMLAMAIKPISSSTSATSSVSETGK
jgi:hypothetical protein